MPLNKEEYSGLNTLIPSSGILIKDCSTSTQTIQVRENIEFRWLYTGGLAIQSLISMDNPAQVLLPVNKALLLGALWTSPSGSILNLGMGGGTIERALMNSPFKLTSVELEKTIIDIAKTYFTLSSHTNIVHSCALNFLSNNKQQQNLITVDLFQSETMPTFVYTPDFYTKLRDNLSIHGTVMINLYPKNNEDLLDILMINKPLFKHIAFVKFSDYNNIVLILSEQIIPSGTELTLMAKQQPDLMNIAFEEIINNIIYLNNTQ